MGRTNELQKTGGNVHPRILLQRVLALGDHIIKMLKADENSAEAIRKRVKASAKQMDEMRLPTDLEHLVGCGPTGGDGSEVGGSLAQAHAANHDGEQDVHDVTSGIITLRRTLPFRSAEGNGRPPSPSIHIPTNIGSCGWVVKHLQSLKGQSQQEGQ